MAWWCKAWIYGRWIDGIAGSISAEGIFILLCLLCVLQVRSLCDELMTYSEEFYRVCVWLCVLWEPKQWGGLGPRWAVGVTVQKCIWNRWMICVYLERICDFRHVCLGQYFWLNVSILNKIVFQPTLCSVCLSVTASLNTIKLFILVKEMRSCQIER